ncbi:MAG: hypothetical protein EOP11_24595 [Proteobacteria bacterium]|nr:MAG: hypothetical protein EOP11_24595 [Pseudomonadota bacterium]
MKSFLLSALILTLSACATTPEEIGGDPAKKADCYEKYALEISLHQGNAIVELKEAFGRQKAALASSKVMPPDVERHWDSSEASLKKANGMRKLFKNCLENAGVELPRE